MHWYGGSIAEAVTLSKQRNAIFVVFVEGDNDYSTQMSLTIDSIDIAKRLSDEKNFLAVKLKSGSTNYTHFAQIYQFVPVPSLFFIGRNGTPLEVVCAGVDPANLAVRIDRILEEHNKGVKPAGPQPLLSSFMQPSTSSQNIKDQTNSLLQAEATAAEPQLSAVPTPCQVEVSAISPEVKSPQVKTTPPRERPDTSSEPAAKVAKTEHQSGQDFEVVCDGDVCVRRPKATDEAGPSQRPEDAKLQTAAEPTREDSMEEKLERAKELIEARRREKIDKEKELEKQKELERRTQGQGMAELKKWQAEQELKQIQEERKREKMENNLARQRILDQIAQDRAERRARDQPPAQNAQLSPAAQTAQQEQVASVGDGSSRARVQFKLPDGTSHTAHFDADGTLSDIQRYIADNLQLSASSFSLWTAFPRRELTDAAASLRQLQLAPSAALLVLPRRSSAPAPDQVAAPSAVTALVAFFTQNFTFFILEPLNQFLVWFRSRVFSSGRPTPPPAVPPPRQSPPPGVRRRGNIHRLPGDSAADDDNNTWNGNSTQQM